MNGLDVFRLLLFLVVTLFCSQTQAQNNYAGNYTGTDPWSSSTVGPGNPPPQAGSNPVTLSIDDSGKLIDFYEGSIPLRVRQQSNFTGGQVDANGVLKFGYDAAGRVISQTDGLGYTQSDQLDGVGHTIKAYDALQRFSAVKDPLEILTSQGYDGDGNRVGLVNGLGKRTQFGFDQADRLTTVKTAVGNVTQYRYNTRNLVASVTQPNGAKASKSYDNAGRLSQLSDGFGTTQYSYDKNGRISQVSDNGYGKNRKVQRSYDALGRLVSYTDENGNTIQYGYDKAGDLIQLTYPNGWVVSYSYDANHRLSRVKDWASRVTSYSYDVNGRLVKTDFPNGVVENRSYDLSGLLVSIHAVNRSGSTIYSCTNSLDSDGRIVSESISPAPSLTLPPIVKLTVDADNRLTTYNGQSVTYDANGNLLKGPAPNGSALSNFSYDVRNRLSEAAGASCRYNPEGRRSAFTGSDGVTSDTSGWERGC
jgi:YD repeat-containing protein